MKTEDIKPESWMEELLEAFPQAQGWLARHGIVCVQCGEPVWASLAQQIASRGLDIESTVENLRRYLKDGTE